MVFGSLHPIICVLGPLGTGVCEDLGGRGALVGGTLNSNLCLIKESPSVNSL